METDIVERLKKWLEKDQIIARNWDENGSSIDGDIELAIEEIDRLRVVITELNRFNNIHNDSEAYLYELALWGLGKAEKPKPIDYGFPEAPGKP